MVSCFIIAAYAARWACKLQVVNPGGLAASHHPEIRQLH